MRDLHLEAPERKALPLSVLQFLEYAGVKFNVILKFDVDFHELSAGILVEVAIA